MKWLVCFDISDDKKRKIISETLEEFGIRVQRSVFEIEITKSKLNKILKKFESMVETREDSIRFYPLYKDNIKNVICLGFGSGSFESDDIYFF